MLYPTSAFILGAVTTRGYSLGTKNTEILLHQVLKSKSTNLPLASNQRVSFSLSGGIDLF